MKVIALICLVVLGVLSAGCQKEEPKPVASTAPVANPAAGANPGMGQAAPANLSTAEKDKIEGKG
ncbi:hypothetical protein [Armatimonas rosea]|uniref:Nitrous oxide reductase accessory protein NosL n=1 Tax=Armatimonas rosea TaxID=685828 RepID=A0A7W9SLY0_ARMRO|nr:hypothetical protein [Armatimonas rosea]MBB6049077.1 nitrous oxide reductase accessory protein NosL [Armatimonas rosea]